MQVNPLNRGDRRLKRRPKIFLFLTWNWERMRKVQPAFPCVLVSGRRDVPGILFAQESS